MAAGTYAHDRWKAESNGCTYTFTAAVPDTTVAITNRTLVQAIRAALLASTSYWLTWQGTATARVWQGSASGSFAAGTATTIGGVKLNALLVTGLTAGTLTGIEFTAGSVGTVKFEAALPGANPTIFQREDNELALCQAYYWQVTATNLFTLSPRVSSSEPYRVGYVAFPVPMIGTPGVTLTARDEQSGNNVGCNSVDPTATGTGIFATAGASGDDVDLTGVYADAELH